MTLILALDIGTVTGVALYDPAKSPSAIDARTIRLKGATIEAKAAELAREVICIIREHGPDFVSIEAPLKNAVRFPKKGKKKQGDMIEAPEIGTETTINPSAIITPNQLTGAAMAVIGIKGKPWCLITPEAWRKQFLGYGRKAGFSRDDYKKAARQKCDQLRISVTTDDAADAVGIAFATPATDEYRWFMSKQRAA